MEIVEAALAVLAKRRFVPRRAIFAAAADIGEDIGIALLDPEQSERTGAIRLASEIAGSLREPETAISVDQRRNGSVHAFLSNQEIRNARSVLGRREALLDGKGAGVELGGKALHRGGCTARSDRIERWRRQHALDRGEGEIAILGDLLEMDRAVACQWHRLAGPAAVRAARQCEQFSRDVVERLHPQHAL